MYSDVGDDGRDLRQAIERVEAKQKEKALREQAEEAEEKRVEVKAEGDRRTLLAERVEEKEALGVEILEKVRQLGQDRLIRKFRRYTGDNWGGFIPIHERAITNPAELRPYMPRDRAVTEVFQLSGRGVLYYNQIYKAQHFAEGMMQSLVRKDPRQFGVNLGKPADFRSLSYASVKTFLDVLNGGGPYRVAAQRMTWLAEEAEREDW